MKKLLICKNACPIVAELEHEIACLRRELKQARKSESKMLSRLNILIAAKKDDEIRIQRAKEALFRNPESRITGGP